MNNRRYRKSSKKREVTKKKLTRCKLLMIPVYENEKCDKFLGNTDKEIAICCRNCEYSF